MMRYWIAAAFAAAMLALSSVAAAAATDLTLAPGKAWTHKHTGITIPATLAGIPRMTGKDYTAPELETSIGFGEAGQDVITVYLFRDTNGAVPIWMAQAQRAIVMREDMPNLIQSVPATPFTPPGQAANSGLKAVYTPDGHRSITSTGVAMFVIDGWYVKMRMTSYSKSAAEVSALMEKAFREIRFPAATLPTGAVQPIADCASKLSFAAASDSKAAAAVLTIGVTRAAPTIRATSWCRDVALENNRAVYRPIGSTDRYLLAVGDAGNALVVQPHAGYYSANFFTTGKTYTLVAQDKLPSPQRAASLIEDNRIVTSFVSWPPR